jgi:YVTN family beta-propeller protein
MSILNRYLVLVFAMIALSFSSCENQDEKPKGKFQTGVFVVNEGNLNSANGTVSHFNLTTKETTQDLFGTINTGKALGDIVQSMTIDGDQAYIVINNSNKLQVVNANTFVEDYTIADLALPRYFTTFNGKGYVTEWVDFLSQGRVSVIDLQSHEVTTNITTDYGAECIVALNNKLFVSNNFSNTVSIIDPADNSVEKTLEVGPSPAGFAVDAQNKLWVISSGSYDFDYNPQNDGKLVQIDPANNTILKTIELNKNVSASLGINKAGSQLFYFSGTDVYRLDVSAAEAPAAPFIEGTKAFYALGVDRQTDLIYLSDAKGFAANGTVYRYNGDGTELDSFTAGIGPNGFVFKY